MADSVYTPGNMPRCSISRYISNIASKVSPKPAYPNQRALFRNKLPKKKYMQSPRYTWYTSSSWVKGSCVTLPADCAMNSHHTAALSGCRAQSSKVKLKLDEKGGPYSIGDSFPGFPTISLSPDSSSGGDTIPSMPNHRASSEKKRSQFRGPPCRALKASFAQVFPEQPTR